MSERFCGKWVLTFDYVANVGNEITYLAQFSAIEVGVKGKR